MQHANARPKYDCHTCPFHDFPSSLLNLDSLEKGAHTSQALSPSASSLVDGSQTLEGMENDEEPGERWDDEEDWGSLEVGPIFNMYNLLAVLEF